MKQFWVVLFFILVSRFSAKAQDLYDIDTIRTFYLEFYDANWDALLDTFKVHDLEDRILADLTVDGIKYDSVGVRYKGNSSYNPNQKKSPLNIKLDYIKKQNLYGYETIKLSNLKDPSFIREVLGYELARNYMAASKANYVMLNINDTLFGLYANVESVDDKFILENFGSENNSFYKCDPVTITGEPAPPPAGCLPVQGISSSLIVMGDDSVCYEQSYEIKSDYGWNNLKKIIDTLDNNPDSVSKYLDIDRVLWMLVYNNVFVNLDSYSGSGHNYYLYEDDYKRFNTIVWDLNMCIGYFTNFKELDFPGMITMSTLYHVNEINRPLLNKLLNIPEYRNKFYAHYRTMYNEFLAGDQFKSRALELHNFIDSYVQADPFKIFNYLKFINSLDSNVPTWNDSIIGINVLMDARKNHLSTHPILILQGPEISNIQISDSLPTSEDTVWITANITNALRTVFYYRTENHAPFTKLIMYDDGLHSDSASGDGIYGVSIPPLSPGTKVHYYIYSENSVAGKFSPERAEYEFYDYTVKSENVSVNTLVINEVMASNSFTIQDQNFEYDDWIEIYNNSDNDICLANMYLSDDINDLVKWTFPDTLIKAHDFIIVWADGDNQEGLHADFKLSKSGEQIILSNSDKTILDSISFSGQITDVSYGRYPNGTGKFQFMIPSFESVNVYTSINEAMNIAQQIRIYPNPANELIYIKTEDNINYLEIELVNLNGEILFNKEINNMTYCKIDLSGFIPGVYFIRTRGVDFISTNKIIKY